MKDKDYYYFLDGMKIPRNKFKTRGIFLNECGHLLPPHLKPILENDIISIRQDAEFPVPAFYIIGIKQEIQSIANLSIETSSLIGTLMHIIRKAMQEVLLINRVNIYLEEKMVNPHFHVWILPMWEDVLAKYDIEPRIWESNIMRYINFFKFEEESDKILKFNNQMREYLKENYLERPSILTTHKFKV